MEAIVEESEKTASVWNPTIRKAMGAIAGAGVVETAYLTWIKVVSGKNPSTTILCAALGGGKGDGGGNCGSVLTGPYSSLPVGSTSIPLASLGLVAYLCVLLLALSPLLANDDLDDQDNRVALTAVATFMGVFSVFLMSLLLGVLHQPCAYCFLSAALSVSLAGLAWLGGALPDQPQQARKNGALVSVGTSLLALSAATFLYVGTPLPDGLLPASPASSLPSYRVLAEDGREQRSSAAFVGRQAVLADADSVAIAQRQRGELPPPITTQSTSRALSIAVQLQALDARFYGAYWCSHCYDQKQALGREAMSKIPYIECGTEGRNAQVQLCKDKKIPGYPTWEIRGTLYPGEQALDELEEIINGQDDQHSPR